MKICCLKFQIIKRDLLGYRKIPLGKIPTWNILTHFINCISSLNTSFTNGGGECTYTSSSLDEIFWYFLFIFLKWFLNSSEGISEVIFKFIRRHLTGTINRGSGWQRTVQQAEFSLQHYYKHKTFNEKILLNSSWCLTVSLIDFILKKIQLITIAFTSVNKSTN